MRETWTALSIVLVLAAAAPAADDAQALFDSVYGQAYRKAVASADREDDLALAGRLLGGAAAAGDRRDLAALLCEKAAELASHHPQGAAAAAQAWSKLADLAPARRAECLEKIAAVRERACQTAPRTERAALTEAWLWAVLDLSHAREDSDPQAALAVVRRAVAAATMYGSTLRGVLMERAKVLAERARILNEVRSLTARLKANDNDDAARESLILLQLAELDDPNAANALVRAGCSEQLRTYVPLTAKPPGSLAQDVMPELAKWALRVAEGRSDAGRRAMLRRACECLRAFVDKHARADEAAVAAKLRLKDIEAQLAEMGDPPVSDGLLILTEDFDAPAAGGTIPGWGVQVSPGNAVALAREADAPGQRAGNRFLGIACRTGNDTGASRRIVLQPDWSRVSLLARVRTARLAPGKEPYHMAGLQVHVRDGGGRIIRSHETRYYVDSDWSPLEVTIDLPRGARTLDMRWCFIGSRGELGVDDLRVYANGTPVANPFHEGFPEGTFEKLTPLGLPVGWGGNPKAVKIVREEGKAVVRLPNPDGKGGASLGTAVRVQPTWQALRLTARVRTTGMQKDPMALWHGAHIDWSFQSAEAVQVGETLNGWSCNSDKAWHNVVLETRVPQGASRLFISLRMGGIPGTLDVAWVKLEPVAPKP